MYFSIQFWRLYFSIAVPKSLAWEYTTQQGNHKHLLTLQHARINRRHIVTTIVGPLAFVAGIHI